MTNQTANATPRPATHVTISVSESHAETLREAAGIIEMFHGSEVCSTLLRYLAAKIAPTPRRLVGGGTANGLHRHAGGP